MQSALYRQFLKRLGLLGGCLVFLTGLQIFHFPAAEKSQAHLQSSDSLHTAQISDAVLEEVREGEYRPVPAVFGDTALTGIPVLFSSSLLCRDLPFGRSFGSSLYSSRAPPAI